MRFRIGKRIIVPSRVAALLLFSVISFFSLGHYAPWLRAQNSSANGEKRITIYSTSANYSLPVTDKNGTAYVGLLELLEPLGKVNAKVDGQRWNLRFNDLKCEFTAGTAHARIQKNDVTLPANFTLENGRGFISLSSLTSLLPQITGSPVTFRESARRLFMAGSEVRFTASTNNATPPALVFNFTLPVNPMIATEPGRLRMVFNHEPLLSDSPALTFADKTIHGATFRENNGAAEIEVTGSAPLFAKFSNDGRTITIVPAPQTSAQAGAPPLQANQAGAAQTPASQALAAKVNPSGKVFAIIDASHGGDERGAALADQIAEKDVTLAFAKRLLQELESRGLSTRLVRDNDVTLNLEQRANQSNAASASLYICVHAASDGNGVRLYTALLPPLPSATAPNTKLFLDWNTAQGPFLQLSHAVETSVAAELTARHIQSRLLIAPLRPLNNITTAAFAIELAPGDGGVSDLNAPQYQQQMAGYIASGILAARAQLEAKR